MKKYMLSFAVMVVAAAAMAFTKANESAVRDVTYYEFLDNDLSDVHNPGNWSEITGTAPGCSGTSLPCIIAVEQGSLESWLNARTDQEIVDDAEMRKD